MNVGMIDGSTSVEELAAIVCSALEAAGIVATLSGGAAVTIYANNEYVSGDLDFVTHGRIAAIAAALAPLGFVRMPGVRQLRHPDTDLYVEFPPGPLSFGETTVDYGDAAVLETAYGALRIVTPTQLVMDRLAAYVHWHDGQSFDQAVMVARHQDLDWDQLRRWASLEGLAPDVLDSLTDKLSGS
jgi:hypothetical protein